MYDENEPFDSDEFQAEYAQYLDDCYASADAIDQEQYRFELCGGRPSLPMISETVEQVTAMLAGGLV